jgi:hypothetical protein
MSTGLLSMLWACLPFWLLSHAEGSGKLLKLFDKSCVIYNQNAIGIVTSSTFGRAHNGMSRVQRRNSLGPATELGHPFSLTYLLPVLLYRLEQPVPPIFKIGR